MSHVTSNPAQATGNLSSESSLISFEMRIGILTLLSSLGEEKGEVACEHSHAEPQDWKGSCDQGRVQNGHKAGDLRCQKFRARGTAPKDSVLLPTMPG